MENRPSIPTDLKRRILIESGHRCAIPTCRFPTTEIAHIEPWSKVREHKYENLIALCPNCHTRFDNGDIDRKSLRIYKRILQRLTDKFDRFELNILNELREPKLVLIAPSMVFLIKNLLDEKLVGLSGPQGIKIEGMPNYTCLEKSLDPSLYQLNEVLTMVVGEKKIEFSPTVNFIVYLTKKGRNFIDEWIKANEKLAY